MPNHQTTTNSFTGLSLEFDMPALGHRLLEIIPGLMSWTTLIGLSILAFVAPFWIAVFIIIFDVYILIRGIYMSVHLVYAYLRLRKMTSINWIERCQKVSSSIPEYLKQVESKLHNSSIQDSLARRQKWQLRQLHQNLRQIQTSGVKVIPWDQIHHIILLSTYNESIEVLRTSLDSLTDSTFPLNRLHVCVGFEERVGESAQIRARQLRQEYEQKFGTFLTTFHPDGLPDEKPVKSANASWAIKKLEPILIKKGISIRHTIVNNFDSDTVANPDYFSYLTYTFITHPDRYHVSYQPLPMYNNNVWDAPAFSRVIATGSTFWQMIESTRPERLVTFSSHAMSLTALKDVGYWQRDIVSEDSRIFWQCLLYYQGHYRTEPLYISISMDAALDDSWWKTLKNQYRQKRRWAWGIENFPFMALGFYRHKNIPRRVKWTYTLRTLEGHFSWATAPIIVAGLGWLPIFFGGPVFHDTVLSYSLPFTARAIMTIAMLGLLISTALSLLLLPVKPRKYSRWRYITMSLQWALFPIIATVLSAFPALDAETRLLLGRDLSFNVTSKSRRRVSST